MCHIVTRDTGEFQWATSSCTGGTQDLALFSDVIGLSGTGDAGDCNSPGRPGVINRRCNAGDLHLLCQAYPVPSVQSFSYRPKERSHFLTDTPSRLERPATPAGHFSCMTWWANSRGLPCHAEKLPLYPSHHPCATPRHQPNGPGDDWRNTSHVLFRFSAGRLQIPHGFPVRQPASLGHFLNRTYILVLSRYFYIPQHSNIKSIEAWCTRHSARVPAESIIFEATLSPTWRSV